MNQKRLQKSFGIRSLSVKLSLVISAICLVAGFLAAALMLKSERKQLLFEETDQVSGSNSLFVAQFERFIDERYALADKANRLVKEALYLKQESQQQGAKIRFLNDGSVRSESAHANEADSAAFIAQANLSPKTRSLFDSSETLWKSISPLMTESFFNFYYISKEGFIRISPPNWAREVPTDHNFYNDIFFNIVTPENAPDMQPRWTPVYYDDIWQTCLITLAAPVYVNNEFMGVTGADIKLSDIVAMLPKKTDDGLSYILFSDRKEVLSLHDRNREIEASCKGRMNHRLDNYDMLDNAIQEQINKMLDNHNKLRTHSANFELDGEQQTIDFQRIDSLNWYLATVRKHSSAYAALHELGIKFFGLFLLYALLVALLLHQTLAQLVIKRIKKLVFATTHISKGNFDTQGALEVSDDEIGSLNHEFNNMALQLKRTVDDLKQKLVEKEAAEQQANRLSKAVEFSGSAVAIANDAFIIEYINPKFLEMTGLTEQDLIGQPLLSMVEQDMRILVEDIEQDLKARHHWRGDTMLANNNDSALWVSLSISPIKDDTHTVYSYVASAQDISFVKESQRRMEQLAYFDTLTGLANRAFFRMQLKKSLALAARGHYSFALFYFDLDEFKRINDTLGHDAGDQLLLEVSSRLQKRLRAEDTIARLGGDEFAVLLSGIDSREKAADVALTIQDALNQPIRLGSNEVIISASIGITMAPCDSPEEDVLLKHADLAMYEAKSRGKNTYYFYNEHLNSAAKERLFIENELRIALKEQQFELYYQPQIDCINGNQITGFEALVRWHHPDLGFIPPDKFIPIAESTGLIVELGEWVLWEACAFAQRVENKGLNTSIAINLSARQFKDSNLKGVLQKVISKTHVDPARLHLELTESMLMGDIDASIKQMHELKALGVSLSIDDFGTGYSSLSYLKKFPLDILKIDRSFIRDIPEDQNDMEITAAIIAMAQKLNLELVAEGVETKEQVEFLVANNCAIVQGYFFSPAISESDVSKYIEKMQAENWQG